MRRILIIEDDQTMRTELKLLLENNGYQTVVLENFEFVLDEMLQAKCDIILLDIQIPNTNGQYLLKEFRKASTTPVMMLTCKNSEIDEVISMSYGADDYMTKPYNPQILLLHIEAILKRGQGTVQNRNYRHIILDDTKSLVRTDEKVVELSKNEYQIFSYLLNHVGTIISRNEMMHYLWNTEDFIDDNTLNVNVNRLRHKLEEVGLVDVIETKRGIGYMLI